MRRLLMQVSIVLGVTYVFACTEQPTPESNTAINTPAVTTKSSSLHSKNKKYPTAERQDIVDTLHATQVSDPYRWLEDAQSQTTKDWVTAQNDLATPYLENLLTQDSIKRRMTELWNYERIQTPRKLGKYYFYRRNDGLQDQDIVYVTESLSSDPRVFIDPNTLREDATVALYQVQPSDDGTLVAYSLSDGGSDWRTWHVRNTETGKDLGDELTYTKFTSVSWLPDNSGFYYSRYPEKSAGVGDGTKPVAVYFHRIGDAQADDKLVYQIKDNPRHNPYATVSTDGNYLVLQINDGFSSNAIHLMKIDGTGGVVQLLDKWDAVYDFIANDKQRFYFRTTNNAPTWRVIAVDANNADPSKWTEVIEAKPESLKGVNYVGGKFFANYLRDANSVVKIFTADGKLDNELDLPGIGSAYGFAGRAKDTETFFEFESFTRPPTIYRYDIALGSSQVFSQASIEANLDRYVTKQEFYTSADGTRVPMFIVHHKDLKLDGTNPTLLYGYGGFDISLTPTYQTTRLVWLEMGGVFAMPNLRGGGEYGQTWHLAGTKTTKQNVFDDFIAAAEYLIDQKYTSPEHLGISGASNGGLLVGATMTQRPELFAAALPAVGVLDMLRYHLPSANARAWSSDYGLADNADEFEALLAYSPYHNIKPGTCYPATLVTTADRDDRVVPWHSYKFTAALQHAQACDKPILSRIETRAGHGAGKPTWMIIENYAYQWAFLAQHLGAGGFGG